MAASVSEQVARKTLDVIIRAAELTPDVLKAALKDMLRSPPDAAQRTETTLGDLAAKSGRKLESIEVNAGNIKDFERAAQKHGVQFALRREVGSDPPVFHVKTFLPVHQLSLKLELDDRYGFVEMQQAFAEYAGIMQQRVKEHTIPKEKRRKIAQAAQRAQNGRSAVQKEHNLSHGEVNR